MRKQRLHQCTGQSRPQGGRRCLREAPMTEQAPKLPRKPFGYDPTVVDQMLSDRDAMLGLAERRVPDAAPAPAAEPEPAPKDEEPLTPQFVTDEISKVIAAAEESTSQILERAWVATRDQVLEADRLWREVQAEVVRFAAWRDEAEAVARGVRDAMDEARRRIEAVPHRIQEALAPVVESMVSVDAGVGKFTAASALPLLLTPSGLEAARARAEAMGHGGELGAQRSAETYAPPPTDVWSDRGETESIWSGMGELDQPDWARPAEPAPESSPEHGSADAEDHSESAVHEASQQLREFLGIPGGPGDEEYQSGHPWGA